METGFSESPQFYLLTTNWFVLRVSHLGCNTSVPALYLSRPPASLELIKNLCTKRETPLMTDGWLVSPSFYRRGSEVEQLISQLCCWLEDEHTCMEADKT